MDTVESFQTDDLLEMKGNMGCNCVVNVECFHPSNEFGLEGRCYRNSPFVNKTSFFFFLLHSSHSSAKTEEIIYTC